MVERYFFYAVSRVALEVTLRVSHEDQGHDSGNVHLNIPKVPGMSITTAWHRYC